MLNFLFAANRTTPQLPSTLPTPVAESLIDLRQVVKRYATPAGDFTALRGIDLQVDRGEFVAVVGKSGSGKSTLSNMITGIDRPSTGEVLVAGTAVHQLNENQTARWRGRTIGVVFQFFQLLPALTVVENVLLPMDFTKLYSERERRTRAMELLAQVDMADQANKLPTELSGGQQQRVAIARAMATDPPIIVADEPTGNLDSRTADAVFSLFERLVESGKTILMVTHDDDLAGRVTRTVTIADGRIESDTKAQPGRVMTPDTVIPVAVPYRTSHDLAKHDGAPHPVRVMDEVAAHHWVIHNGGAGEQLPFAPKNKPEPVVSHHLPGYLGNVTHA